MNLIKVKNIVIDFDRVVAFERGYEDRSVDIILSEFPSISLDISLSDFCNLLKFYNIDIKELK